MARSHSTDSGSGGEVVPVFMDNFFSSVSLYHRFLLENIYCTGTVRSNRHNFPPDLKCVVKRGLAQRGDVMTR